MTSGTRACHVIATLALVTIARAGGAQPDVPPGQAKIAAAVRADLARLLDLERAFFAENKRFSSDAGALHFTPASGAQVAVTYASVRSFSATATDARLGPFVCIVIATSGEAGSHADKPFCTDSRYGTAAAGLARLGTEVDSAPNPPQRIGAVTPSKKSVTPVTLPAPSGAAGRSDQPPDLSEAQFAARLAAAADAPADSVMISVHFTVSDARYDPSRGVLEVAIARVPLPLRPSHGASSSGRPALACYTQPIFVCGEAGLTYIARGIFHLSQQHAPDPALVRSGLGVNAKFVLGRRDDTVGPALTLVALLLQAKGEVIARWDGAAIR